MDSGIATFLTIFGAAAIAFGLWMRPRWKRARLARQSRDERLLFSPARAREWLLWWQVFPSIGAGAFMLFAVGGERLHQYWERRQEAAERARVAQLERYVASCTDERLLLRNPDAQPRRIRLGKPIVIEHSRFLAMPSEEWHASWLAPADVLLAPGQELALRYSTTPGVWGSELTFDLDVDNARAGVDCSIQRPDSTPPR